MTMLIDRDSPVATPWSVATVEGADESTCNGAERLPDEVLVWKNEGGAVLPCD